VIPRSLNDQFRTARRESQQQAAASAPLAPVFCERSWAQLAADPPRSKLEAATERPTTTSFPQIYDALTGAQQHIV